MLINNFMPPVESDMFSYQCNQAKKEVLKLVHTALEVLVDLVPMAALKLARTVINKRPMFFKKDSGMNFLKFCVSSVCCYGFRPFLSIYCCAQCHLWNRCLIRKSELS